MSDKQTIGEFLDGLEKEFINTSESNKAVIMQLIANLDVHCRNCYVQQQKKRLAIGLFGRQTWMKPKPYDLNISGAVTQMVGHGLSLGLSKTMRTAMDLYADEHTMYDCGNGVTLIHEIYNRFSKHYVTKTNTS